MVAVAAPAQPGSIGPYADMAGTSPHLVDNGGLVQVHFLHVNIPGAISSQFMLNAPASWAHLGDTWSTATSIGTSITGVSLGYGSCLAGPIYLGFANFFGSSVPECTEISIVPDPLAPTGMIEGADCRPAKIFPNGGMAIVNPNETCQVT